jgi:hypothetical protein
MTQRAVHLRRHIRSSRPITFSMLPVFCGILVFCCMPGTGIAKNAEKPLTTANGKAVRKVYVDAANPVMANAATARLNEDTCLAVVPNPQQADAVLEVGITLPSVSADSAGGPDIFGSQPTAQTLGNAHSEAKRSASATCGDGKGGTMDCKSSYSVQGGDPLRQPAANWTEGISPSYTVSLAPSENSTEDLWDPNGRDKHSSWSNQLRQAVGCPVCPGEKFDPRRAKLSYRQWMQAKCPEVLKAPAE